MKTPSSTRALTIVAWMFIADGVWTVIVITVSFLNGYGADSTWSIVNIWLGVGLLMRRRWAITLGPVSLFISIAMGIVGLVLTAFFNTEPSSIVETLGYPFASVLRAGTMLAISANLAFNLWQFRVLTRSTVWALFTGTEQEIENPALSGAPLGQPKWWLAQDLRVLVSATIVILVAIHLESRVLDSKRLKFGIEECRHDYRSARTALDTAEIDTRAVAPTFELVFKKSTVQTCQVFRQ